MTNNNNETETDNTYQAECPHCEQDTTFSVGNLFGNLSCDSCGYMPKRKVRYEEIRGEEMS